MKTENKKYIILIFCTVFVCNFVIKLLGINTNPIAMDEPFSIYQAQFSVGSIINTLMAGNNPPLYEIFLHFWIKIVGIEAFWVRLPSVLFSSLAVSCWVLIIAGFLSLMATFGFSLLLTFSTQFILYAHEARAYALLLLMLALATLFVTRLLQGKKSLGNITLAALFSGLAVYVHYLALVPVGAMVLYLAIGFVRSKEKHLLFYVLGTGMSLLPIGWLVIQRVQSISQKEGLWGHAPEWTQLYGYLNIFLNGRASLLFILLSALLAIGYILTKKRWISKSDIPPLAIFSVFVFLAGYFFMYFISFRHPIFIERYVQVMFPYFFLAITMFYAFWEKRHKVVKALWCFFLFLVCVQVNLYPKNGRNPDKVAENAKRFFYDHPDGMVLLAPHWYQVNLAYFFDQKIFAHKNLSGELNRHNIFPVWGSEDAQVYIKSRSLPQNLLYIDAGDSFVNGYPQVLDILRSRYGVTGEDNVDDATVVYYLRLNDNNFEIH